MAVNYKFVKNTAIPNNIKIVTKAPGPNEFKDRSETIPKRNIQKKPSLSCIVI